MSRAKIIFESLVNAVMPCNVLCCLFHGELRRANQKRSNFIFVNFEFLQSMHAAIVLTAFPKI